jgi:molybdate ABC transporter, permease protein
MNLDPVRLSLLVAAAATLLVVPPGILAAYLLARHRRFPGRAFVETLLSLPLVLPPSVVGFGLLMALGQGTAFGRWLNDAAGVRLLFTWQGAAVAAAVIAFPLFVRTASATFASLDPEMLEVGRTLGASEPALLRYVLAPLAFRGLLAALTLAFARALGEFGATLMVAGSIPGQTETLPLALYAAVQAGDNEGALAMAAGLTLVAFLALWLVGLYTDYLAGRQGER